MNEPETTMPMGSHCPSCGAEASGKFCSSCGTSLVTVQSCRSCGNQIPDAGRFCNLCGTAVASSAERAPATTPAAPAEGPVAATRYLPWAVAGALVLVLVGVLVWPDSAPEATGVTAAPVGAAPALADGDPRAIDLASMSPREAADRLFNRVMQNVSVGDTASALTFVPMAIAAYDRVDDIDIDGRYHRAVLHLVNRDPTAARAEADLILTDVPNHLLALHVAAKTEEEFGNRSAARAFYRRLMDNYREELSVDRREYAEHAPMLATIREDATTALEDE